MANVNNTTTQLPRNTRKDFVELRADVFAKLQVLMKASDAYFNAVQNGKSTIEINDALCVGLAAMCEFSRAKQLVEPWV
jgi:hypothetical protein